MIVKALCILCVENLQSRVQVIIKRLCVVPSSGKEDMARYMQISYPMRSWFCVSMHVRILKEDNKEDEELVDVAPHWGEPRISCVMVALCIMVVC